MAVDEHTTINWRLVILVELSGALLILFAILAEHYWRWQGVSQSILANIGSALLLGGILYFVQRRFIVRVAEAVKQAAADTVRSETLDIRTHLDELDSRVDSALSQRDERRDATVSELNLPTYSAVARAIGTANELKAIDRAQITVAGSEPPGPIYVTFSWGWSSANGRFNEEAGEELVISIKVADSSDQPNSLPWRKDESATDFGVRLMEEIRRSGNWKNAEQFSWSIALTNLREALDWASKSRRGAAGSESLRGQLLEMVATDWGLTTEGVECPKFDLFIPLELLPDVVNWRNPEPEEPWQPPRKPAEVAEELWELVIRRVRSRFPLPPGVFKTFPDWMPLSHGPTEE